MMNDEIEDLLAMYEKNPRDVGVINSLAYILKLDNQSDKALNAYLLLAKIDPTFPGACKNCAELLEAKAEYERARQYYERALDAEDAKCGPLYMKLGHCYQLLGQYEKASSSYNKVLLSIS